MKNKVLFILLSFSLCFPLIAVSQNTHRENGWYHVIGVSPTFTTYVTV